MDIKATMHNSSNVSLSVKFIVSGDEPIKKKQKTKMHRILAPVKENIKRIMYATLFFPLFHSMHHRSFMCTSFIGASISKTTQKMQQNTQTVKLG